MSTFHHVCHKLKDDVHSGKGKPRLLGHDFVLDVQSHEKHRKFTADLRLLSPFVTIFKLSSFLQSSGQDLVIFLFIFLSSKLWLRLWSKLQRLQLMTQNLGDWIYIVVQIYSIEGIVFQVATMMYPGKFLKSLLQYWIHLEKTLMSSKVEVSVIEWGWVWVKGFCSKVGV